MMKHLQNQDTAIQWNLAGYSVRAAIIICLCFQKIVSYYLKPALYSLFLLYCFRIKYFQTLEFIRRIFLKYQ